MTRTFISNFLCLKKNLVGPQSSRCGLTLELSRVWLMSDGRYLSKFFPRTHWLVAWSRESVACMWICYTIANAIRTRVVEIA